MATTTIMSLDEFRRMPEFQPDGTSYELDEGELVRVSPGGSKHSVVVQRISHYLEALDVDMLPDGYFTEPPFIAIEVIGAKHDAEQLEKKITQYLAAGVREVWAVYVKSKRTYIYRGAQVEVIEPGRQYLSNALGLSVDTRFFFLRHKGRE